MSGEVNYFRKRFFGGFNRQDVVDYIAKLAKERNESTAAKDKAVKEVQSLTNEVESLQAEVKSLRDSMDEVNQAAEKLKTEALETA